jgi:hypothetical protein
MKTILLASMLALTVLLNGCAFSLPWWLFLRNDPAQHGHSADRLVTERLPVEKSQQPATADTEEMAKCAAPAKPAAH